MPFSPSCGSASLSSSTRTAACAPSPNTLLQKEGSPTSTPLSPTSSLAAPSASLTLVRSAARARMFSRLSAANLSICRSCSLVKSRLAPCRSSSSTSFGFSLRPPVPAPVLPSSSRSNEPLPAARSSEWLSNVSRVSRLYTRTGLVSPVVWQRACAWMLFCGLQSGSNRMTVSAACTLTPQPPARVPSRKRKIPDPSAQKRSTAACLFSPATAPSSRSYA
mmetsp:Transcript_12756/g.29968  ORF Transcript_12756/g.29968 Transcript_12756/m.29968 type:complete len:220 (-) Transcript_12756:1046-1705(-)